MASSLPAISSMCIGIDGLLLGKFTAGEKCWQRTCVHARWRVAANLAGCASFGILAHRAESRASPGDVEKRWLRWESGCLDVGTGAREAFLARKIGYEKAKMHRSRGKFAPVKVKNCRSRDFSSQLFPKPGHLGRRTAVEVCHRPFKRFARRICRLPRTERGNRTLFGATNRKANFGKSRSTDAALNEESER